MSRSFAEIAAHALHLAFIVALTVLGSTGCGSDGGGSEQGPSISPLLDTDRRTSASIGPDGGSVAVTAADGTQYSLVVPPDTVLEDTEISLTPILSIDDLPMSGGLLAGVHFEPSGLELFRTATLTVTLPEAPSFGSEELLAAFTYDGDGDDLALGIAAADANAFMLPITHFSGGGGGSATPADLKQAFPRGSADAFVAEALEAASKSDNASLESSVRRWYAELVKPALQAGVASDAALERALSEYRRWLLAASFASGLVDLNDVLSESQSLGAAALNDAIARANDLCERQESFTEAETALLWQRRAESVLPEDLLLANGLDRTSVQRDLCVQVVFESTSFPEAPAIGEPALLEMIVGFAFGEEPIEFSSGMVVNVLATGATPAGATEFTDASGVVELTLTPNGATVAIEVDACIGLAVGAGTLTGGFICQEAFIVRGLVVSPSTVTLASGASQQFSAQLVGVDEPVTWSATGGTIDPNGLFTAGSAAGAFTVTATSVAEPTLVATAEVTIDGDPGDPVTTAWLGTAACFDVDKLFDAKPSGVAVIQTGTQLEIHFPRVDPGTGDPPFRTSCVPNDFVYLATISGGSFSGSTNDCNPGPCPISGSIDGDTISGTAVWNGDCTCYTDFEATIANECAVLSSGSDPIRMSCSP